MELEPHLSVGNVEILTESENQIGARQPSYSRHGGKYKTKQNKNKAKRGKKQLSLLRDEAKWEQRLFFIITCVELFDALNSIHVHFDKKNSEMVYSHNAHFLLLYIYIFRISSLLKLIYLL